MDRHKEITEIQETIRVHTQPVIYRDIDQKAVEADIVWNASRFWSVILQHASYRWKHLDDEAFRKFAADFQTIHQVSIDVDAMFKRFWLRNVLDVVHIAGAVNSIVYSFDTIASLRQEHRFLHDLYMSTPALDHKKVISREKFQQALTDYEKQHQIELDESGLGRSRYVAMEDNIDLTNLSALKVYLDHWDEFSLLNAYRKKTGHHDEGDILIEKTSFEKIHRSFADLYPKIPSIEKLKEQNAISIRDEQYALHLSSGNIKYWSTLRDKISAYYWELLLDESPADVSERFDRWLHMMTRLGSWADPLDHLTVSSKVSLLDQISKRLFNEPDLAGVNDEFEKVRLDLGHSAGIHSLGIRHLTGYSITAADLYEMITAIAEWEKSPFQMHLNDQSSRHALNYLLQLIVEHEPEYPEPGSPSTNNRIAVLLQNGVEKPHLAWQTSEWLVLARPEWIVHMLASPEFGSLAFLLLDKLKITTQEPERTRLELWKRALRLVLHDFPPLDGNVNGVARFVFQLFRQVNAKKYATRPVADERLLERQYLQKREQEILELLENASKHRMIYGIQQDEYLLPEIFETLAGLFNSWKRLDKLRNGTMAFPLEKWDGMFWLMKIATYFKYRYKALALKSPVNLLAISFLGEYQELLETHEIRSYNYFEEREVTALPLWSEKIERLEWLDWLYPVFFLDRLGKLDDFLSPRISIEPTDDKYHKANQFAADKLRTHIGVLLQVIQRLMSPDTPFGFEKKDTQRIRMKVETRIREYIRHYARHIPAEGKVDLFEFGREWRWHSTDKEALMPQIAGAINMFSEKEEMIDSIVASGDLIKILTLLDVINSEGVRARLLNHVRSLDVKALLKDLLWLDQLQYTINKLARYPELVEKIEDAVRYLQEEVPSKKRDPGYNWQLYRLQLLVGYLKNSESGIDAIPEPDRNDYAGSRLTPYDYKQFYKGTLFIQSNPVRSFAIFSDLHKRFPAMPGMALNRMVAKINRGEAEGNTQLFREAFEEWKLAIRSADEEAIAALEPNLSLNLMTIFLKLGELEQLDNRYGLLDRHSKMLPEILRLKVHSLADRKRVEEAVQLLKQARQYHQYGASTDLLFLDELESLVRGVDDIDILRHYFNRIFDNKPERLIAVLPLYLNGKTELTAFLTKEVVSAADRMLEKIKALDRIADENKYSDVMEMLLNARLTHWKWSSGSQSRGGFAGGSEPLQPGERDLSIRDGNANVLLVIEAFILRNPARTHEHLFKVFNYDHKRKEFLILVYDQQETGPDFHANWKKYITKTVPKTTFPDGMQLDTLVEDITVEYTDPLSAIKVGRSVHRNGSNLYHVMVNIHYRIDKVGQPLKNN